MTVNEERVALLADALDSGEYEQGRSFLHTRNPVPGGGWQHRWCCLGVAGDTAFRHGLAFARRWVDNTETLDGSDQLLGPLVRNWYGFSELSPMLIAPRVISATGMISAAAWNDAMPVQGKDCSFTAIAAGFRETFL